MSISGDTIFRQWSMLRSIPREPRKASTSDVYQQLVDQGYMVTNRTVQRDLDGLSVIFGYTSETEGRINYWFWPKDSPLFDLPGLEPSAALVFLLTDKYLKRLIPEGVTHYLSPYLERSREVLDTEFSNGLSRWEKSIRFLDKGPQLKAPNISPNIQAVVYESIMRNKQLEVTYKPRTGEEKSYTLNPAGIVVKGGVIYLVATAWKFENFIQLALHRLISVAMTEQDACIPDSLSFVEYVDLEQAFSYPNTDKIICLEFFIEKDAAIHLEERPLSENQTICECEDGRLRLTAEVIDTSELRWWLMGFADQIEIAQPKSLRNWFASVYSRLHSMYQ